MCDAEQPVSSCLTCEAVTRGLCAGLGQHELMALAGIRQSVRRLPPGTELFHQGDGLDSYFIVLEGWVALTVVLEDGALHVPDFALPGGFLGLLPRPEARVSYSARCVTSVAVCQLARIELDALVEQHPTMATRMLQLAAGQKDQLLDHMTNIASRHAYQRVARLLLELFYRSTGRLPVGTQDATSLPLTRAQIGAATAL